MKNQKNQKETKKRLSSRFYFYYLQSRTWILFNSSNDCKLICERAYLSTVSTYIGAQLCFSSSSHWFSYNLRASRGLFTSRNCRYFFTAAVATGILQSTGGIIDLGWATHPLKMIIQQAVNIILFTYFSPLFFKCVVNCT